MDELQTQEKYIYTSLYPTFRENGYAFHPDKKLFWQPTGNGYRAALISVNGDRLEQSVELKLGIRLDVVEDLVGQFLGGLYESYTDRLTFLASYGRVVQQPQRFLVKGEEDLEAACKRIGIFMTSKGFKFLENNNRLRKIDGIINRKPENTNPYLLNQVHRCFKGLVLAKLTHRTDFNRLVKTYYKFLQKQNAKQTVIMNYKKLVRFLRFYSIN